MDDLLRSTLAADAIPAIMRHLPELDVNQPDKASTHALDGTQLAVKTNRHNALHDHCKHCKWHAHHQQADILTY